MTEVCTFWLSTVTVTRAVPLTVPLLKLFVAVPLTVDN